MFLIKPFDNFLSKIMLACSSLLLFVLISIGLAYIYLEINLPDVETLKDIHFQQPLRIYSKDAKLMAEFGTKRRTPITLEEVPKPLIDAILATEDQRFFDHPGIDLPGLVRAAINLIKTGSKSQGASTITMQVARNFFLSKRKTFTRKINEILLAIKIDKELPKDKILELYLNKIYFGSGAYGVAAAAQVYYNKKLSELKLSQFAMIAGLPQAPSRINPIANPKSALKRRHHVLNRMLDENLITKKQYKDADNDPITATFHRKQIQLHAPYVAELIRAILHKHFGDAIYTSGYKIYSTIDSIKQVNANKALVQSLEKYDKRHGYRGPVDHVNNGEEIDWDKYEKTAKHFPCVVTEVNEKNIIATSPSEETIEVPFQNMQWARKQLPKGNLGKKLENPADVLSVGDIIHVQLEQDGSYSLSQIPEIEGGLVAINPNNDNIEALVGGYDFSRHKFNHVTQAKRQPGSSFKPFIYSAALEKGYTLASIINDAPVVQKDQSQDNFLWRPKNDNRQFKGLTSLRQGLTSSINLVSIRLLDSIGLEFGRTFAAKFGFPIKEIPKSLSIALGSASVTPLSLATGYCSFPNGGKKSKPFLVDLILDSRGKILLNKEDKSCKNCVDNSSKANAEQVISPQIAYLMTSVLKGTIHRGRTGWLSKKHLNRTDIAGKTGSTNNNKDAWFAGFNPSLVTVTWVGFDNPKSIYEYGSRAAFPMWLEFMKATLKNKPEIDTIEPKGMVRARIDPKSGLLASSDQEDSFFEIFREEYAPSMHTNRSAKNDETSTNTSAVKYLF